MGTYVITGGSSGIGAKTAAFLRKEGHEVLIISRRKGEILADLSIPEGRQKALDAIHEKCPDGLDGLVCSAGVAADTDDFRQIVSVNFFGTISIVGGLYDLLKKKHGSCVVTTSNAISQGTVRMDIADMLNNHNDNEQRILNLMSHLEASYPQEKGIVINNDSYIAAKYALARWMRRHSASYAANGVRINAVAPGNVNTSMTGTMSTSEKAALNALPIPTKYGREELMEPQEVASAIVFLLSEAARGINGIILFVDGGTDALLNAEKVY